MADWELDSKQVDRLLQTVTEFADGKEAESIINGYLAGDGGDILKTSIQKLLPKSGRAWRGKRAAAKDTDPFEKTAGNLNVRIHTKNNYHYLYFPDDGSSTINHYGNQQFMLNGGEAKSTEIGEEIINKLVERLEG